MVMVLLLCTLFHNRKANTAHAEIALMHPDIKKAVEIMVDVWTAEQRHEDDVAAPGQALYVFTIQPCI